MSTIKTNAILDASGGSTTTINGVTPNAYNTMGKNRIINGAMEIDQRNAGASITLSASGLYIVDRMKCRLDASSSSTGQQSSTAPTGFSNSAVVTIGTGAAPTSGQIGFFVQGIEGYNFSDFGFGSANAKSITLSFWIRSSVTGTFSGALRNAAANRAYIFEYTINVANTWEQKSITIAGDTTGTWLTTNGAGAYLLFNLGTGSTGLTTTGWAAGNYYGSTGSTSLCATSGATWYITGVQLEVGSVATEFERRPYGMELALCQRYYQHSYATGTAVGTATSVGAAHQGGGQNGSTTGYLAGPWILFPVQLRTFPTVTVWDIGGNSGYCHRFTYAVGGANSQPYNIAATSDKSIYGYSSGSTNYAGVAVHWRVEAEL